MNSYKDFFELIDSSIKELKNELPKDELAFLGMTSKVERQVQDKLAYILHKKLTKRNINLFVGREWTKTGVITRADIAIITKIGEIRCLIELKATNTHSEINLQQVEKKHIKGHGSNKGIKQDLTGKIPNECDIFFGIFLACHPTEIIDQEKSNCAIKYYNPNIYKNQQGVTPQKRLDAYNELVESSFKDFSVNGKKLTTKKYPPIDVGKYYDTPIQIIVHLIYSKEGNED